MFLKYLNIFIYNIIMAQFDETQFNICGETQNMIHYKGKIFSILYPIEQIEEDIENNCLNCQIYGSWNGCIIMRCINCDKNGCGSIYKGVEINSINLNSANNTYLKGIDWSKIGDKYIEDSELLNLNKLELLQTKETEYVIERTSFPYTCTPIELSETISEEEEEEEEYEIQNKIKIFLDDSDDSDDSDTTYSDLPNLIPNLIDKTDENNNIIL
jgi:hypothetical protein